MSGGLHVWRRDPRGPFASASGRSPVDVHACARCGREWSVAVDTLDTGHGERAELAARGAFRPPPAAGCPGRAGVVG